MIKHIKVCLNGGRGRHEHPAIPITSTEVARAAAAAVAAGAEAVHVHPRGDDGAESLQPGHVASTVAAVHLSCPAVPVGVSTGLWITAGDDQLRRTLVRQWGQLPAVVRPDFASVNASEPGFTELVEVLHR